MAPYQVIQPDLFRSSPGINWFPGETVFSLASRYHLLSRNVHAQRTAIQLFGGPRSGFPHDLPGGINHFAYINQGYLGTAESIVRDHTILPFFLPFRDPLDTDEAIALMRDSHIGSLKSKLGMLASRFGATSPLRACRVCMETDCQTLGVAYWHRDHQLPGIWLCPQHGLPLEYSARVASGEARFHWLLPKLDDLHKGFDGPSPAEARNRKVALWRFMQAVLEVARLPPGRTFETSRLLATFREGLEQKQLLSAGGRMHINAMAQSYFDAMQSIRSLPELASIAPTLSLAAAQASRLLREPRGGTHTLRQLTVVIWLFGSWEAFSEAYDSTAPSKIAKSHPRASMSPRASKTEHGSKRDRLVGLLQQPGTSVSRAAHIVGVEPVTAQAWAAQAGITSPKRPKLLNPNLRRKLIALLTAGLEKADAAKQCSVSVSSVNRILRTEVGLHAHWRNAHNKRMMRESRTRWRKALTTAHHLGVTEARSLEPKAYAWLYRNDRTWLRGQNHQIKPPARGNNSHIDWDVRDQELTHRITTAVHELTQHHQKTPITIALICRHVKGLKPKLPCLENLPRTAQALRRATRNARMKIKPRIQA